MYLTEEQVQAREDIFIDLIEAISKSHYDLNEEYIMTEDDAYITSILMDFFVENYKQPTMRDSVVESYTGVGPNDELFEAMITLMLDESIGSFVAGAAHGLNKVFANKKQQRTGGNVRSTAHAARRAKSKYDLVGDKSEGKPVNTLSGAFHAGKLKTAGAKMQKAADKKHDAEQEHAAATKAHSDIVAKQKNLAQRIDTGISNVKNKVTGAVKSGANKVAGAIGRVAGHFA
jgi:hypothetical protein